MIAKKLAHALTAAAVAAGLAVGSPADAAGGYAYQLAAGACTLDLVSLNYKMNQQTEKDIDLKTTDKNYGCTLQVFPYSDSDAYNAYVAPANGKYPGGPIYYPIHRVRICQSGAPGSCSAYEWWDGSFH